MAGGEGGNALEDARRQKNQQYLTPHLTFTSVASRAAVLNFEVPRCRIITEITAEIPLVAVPKMKVSYLLDILVGCVGNIDQLPVDEVGKKVLIGLPPLLCSGSCLGWHRAEMEEREGSGSELWLC